MGLLSQMYEAIKNIDHPMMSSQERLVRLQEANRLAEKLLEQYAEEKKHNDEKTS